MLAISGIVLFYFKLPTAAAVGVLASTLYFYLSIIEEQTMISTPHGIEMYRMAVIHKALNFYIQHGKSINKMYTPGNMVQAVAQKTGKQYKASTKGIVTGKQIGRAHV